MKTLLICFMVMMIFIISLGFFYCLLWAVYLLYEEWKLNKGDKDAVHRN